MKIKAITHLLLAIFILCFLNIVVGAPSGGYNQLSATADLIIVGIVTDVNDLEETNTIEVNGVRQTIRGVETTFKVSKVIKGQLTTNVIMMHHYRLDRELPSQMSEQIGFTPNRFNEFVQQKLSGHSFSMPSGLVVFTPNSTNEFGLYLVRDGTGSFSPASGQINASFSVDPQTPPFDFSHIHQADPSIREEYQIQVPSNLSVERIKGVLKIFGSRNSPIYTNLMVGTNMMMGMWCDVYVYSAEMSRPTNHCHNLEPDIGVISPNASIANKLEFNVQSYYWRPDGKGIAVPFSSSAPWIKSHEGSVVAGMKYNIEIDLTIFETDYPKVDRSWDPQSARYYKVLWQRTLKSMFE